MRQLKRGDIVLLPGKKKIQGTVLKVINNVVMVLPWNSGKEDIFLNKELTYLGRDIFNLDKDDKRNY